MESKLNYIADLKTTTPVATIAKAYEEVAEWHNDAEYAASVARENGHTAACNEWQEAQSALADALESLEKAGKRIADLQVATKTDEYL